jgi:DNA polymerase-3 subunit gamma/tau
MGLESTLAQKYRPLLFRDVLDQDTIITVLKNILGKRKLSVPFMFTGNYGGGKTTLARIFARAILCKNLKEDLEPCNECSSCKSFLDNTNLAYTEIDAASNSGVDQIRKLREQASFKVLGDSNIKVTVIDECHSITSQGNEALLKQLEDGNESQVYIFCTTAPEKMLDTVRSRCFEFSLNKIKPQSISERLKEIASKEKIEYEDEALDLISDHCCPHVRDSIKSLDYLSNYGKISKSLVFEHFRLDQNTSYLNIIKNVANNLSECLILSKDILNKSSVVDIYEGLISNIIKIKKLIIGIDEFKNKEQKDLALEIYDKLKDNLDNILEELLKRNRYSDQLTLESDLIILNRKISKGFTYANFQVIENSSTIQVKTEELSKVDENKNEKVISEDSLKNKIPEDIPEKSIENTTKILNRYKSYPEALALMMDRGKKSSSLKNTETVELNQTVRDFKKNLDTDDLKNYINRKRAVT